MTGPAAWRALVAAGAAALVAGCGGGGDDKAAYLAQADGICARVNTQIVDVGTPQSPGQFQSFAERAIPIVQDGLRRLRAPKAPPEIADDVDEVFANVAKGVELIRQAGAAGKASDVVRLQGIGSEVAALAAETGRKAEAVGFKECGQIAGL
jgi:hypothetical protein